MYYLRYLEVFFVFMIFECQSTFGIQKWETIATSTKSKVQESEVYAFLDRIQANLSSKFDVTIQPKPKLQPNYNTKLEKVTPNTDFVNFYSSGADDQKVKVEANSGIAATWGIHHYLKYYCGCHFSWDTVRIGKCNENYQMLQTHATIIN